MSYLARGRSYKRAIGAPFHCTLFIEVKPNGQFGDLALMHLPLEVTPVQRFMMTRAMIWTSYQLLAAAERMVTAGDILAELPMGPITEMERVILQEISAVQQLRAGAVASGEGWA